MAGAAVAGAAVLRAAAVVATVGLAVVRRTAEARLARALGSAMGTADSRSTPAACCPTVMLGRLLRARLQSLSRSWAAEMGDGAKQIGSQGRGSSKLLL